MSYYFDYQGVIARPNLNIAGSQNDFVGPKDPIPVTSDFRNETVAVGRPNRANQVKIYTYTSSTNTWSSTTTLTGSSTFGTSVSMNWDGTRLIVGEPGSSTVSGKVHIYDKNPSTGVWSLTQTITKSANTDFGYSTSIAANTGHMFCVGAPTYDGSIASPPHPTVYVYELINNTWTQTFSNTCVDIDFTLPLYGGSFIVDNQYSRYGHSVSMSYNGEHILVGAPGTNLVTYDSSNTNITTGDVYRSNFPTAGSDYQWTDRDYNGNEGVHYNIMRGVGWARVFTRGTNSTWSGNTTQLGNILNGETIYNFTSKLLEPANIYGWQDSNQTSWSMPSFGQVVDIAKLNQLTVDDVRIAISSPTAASPINQTYGHAQGNVRVFKYNTVTSNWDEEQQLVGTDVSEQYGSAMKLDYTGERICISASKFDTTLATNNKTKKLHVLDWNGTNWWEAQPMIYMYDGTSYDTFQLSMTDGKHILVTSARNGELRTQRVVLTQQFIGNSLFEGYIASNHVYVGANETSIASSSENTKGNKTISFGGFLGDSMYENTTIENRTYDQFSQGDSVYRKGRTELLVTKFTSALGVDAVRIISGEILLGNTFDGAVAIRSTNGQWSTNPFNKYNRTSNSLGVDLKGNVGIRPIVIRHSDESTTNIPAGTVTNVNDSREPGTISASAAFDVNGDATIRSKLILSDPDRLNRIGFGKEPPDFGYDTCNYSILYGGNKVKCIESRSDWDGAGAAYVEGFGELEGGATLSKTEKAFEFGSSGGYVESTCYRGSNNITQRAGISFWLKLSAVHNSTNYPGSVIWHTNRVHCMINGNGIYLVTDGTHTATFSSFTFSIDTWYHILVKLPGGISSSDPPPVPMSSTNTSLTINGTEYTPSLSGLSANVYWNGPHTFTIGKNYSGIRNAYIGLFSYYVDWADSGAGSEIPYVPTVQNLIDYGSPTDVLMVNGDIQIKGDIYQNGTLFTGGGGGGGGSSQWTTVNTNEIYYALGNVGIGVTNPSHLLDVAGNINFTGDLYQNGSLYQSSQWSTGSTGIYYIGANVSINSTVASYELDVNGTIRATTDVLVTSDQRVKTDIKKIEGALDKICKIGGYTYTRDGKRSTGCMAQEVKKVLPEVVRGSDDTEYALAYGNMTGLIIEAIKELKGEIDGLKSSLGII